jgi:protein phosphatase
MVRSADNPMHCSSALLVIRSRRLPAFISTRVRKHKGCRDQLESQLERDYLSTIFELSGQSHAGTVREHNEDAIWFDAGRGVAIVADGVGGHNAGEVASRLTVETFAEYTTKTWSREMSVADTKTIMVDSLLSANKIVRDTASESPDKYRMGTTAVALCLGDGIYGIANVGDSRAYLLRPAEIHQITQDHSYVQDLVESGEISKTEARQHPERNMINRCVGTDANIEVDFFHGHLKPCEYLLLCSDGVHDLLEDREILSIVSSRMSVDDMCLEIIAKAIAAGGYDNASVVIAQQG